MKQKTKELIVECFLYKKKNSVVLCCFKEMCWVVLSVILLKARGDQSTTLHYYTITIFFPFTSRMLNRNSMIGIMMNRAKTCDGIARQKREEQMYGRPDMTSLSCRGALTQVKILSENSMRTEPFGFLT